VSTSAQSHPKAHPKAHATASDLSALIRDHQGAIWRYLRFLGCDAGESDDLTQETFLAVVGKPVHRFGESGARAYLRTVARHFYLRLRAQRHRQPAVVDIETAEEAFDWFTGDEVDDDGGEKLGALRLCLRGLTPASRTALELRYTEGLDRRAIAERMAMTTHGIKSLLQRSYARLRVCMAMRLHHDQ
jgi:RNA polymerase sigma-70 factor (ECF subfamily)